MGGGGLALADALRIRDLVVHSIGGDLLLEGDVGAEDPHVSTGSSEHA
jgi:hypothetical protein